MKIKMNWQAFVMFVAFGWFVYVSNNFVIPILCLVLFLTVCAIVEKKLSNYNDVQDRKMARDFPLDREIQRKYGNKT